LYLREGNRKFESDFKLETAWRISKQDTEVNVLFRIQTLLELQSNFITFPAVVEKKIIHQAGYFVQLSLESLQSKTVFLLWE
jgi:hypothetical protein